MDIDKNVEFSLPVVIPDKVLMQDLDGETVLLNLDNGHYYGLNEIGTDIWKLLVAGKTVEDCLPSLLMDYDVNESILREDIKQLLHDLCEKGLVTL